MKIPISCTYLFNMIDLVQDPNVSVELYDPTTGHSEYFSHLFKIRTDDTFEIEKELIDNYFITVKNNYGFFTKEYLQKYEMKVAEFIIREFSKAGKLYFVSRGGVL